MQLAIKATGTSEPLSCTRGFSSLGLPGAVRPPIQEATGFQGPTGGPDGSSVPPGDGLAKNPGNGPQHPREATLWNRRTLSASSSLRVTKMFKIGTPYNQPWGCNTRGRGRECAWAGRGRWLRMRSGKRGFLTGKFTVILSP